MNEALDVSVSAGSAVIFDGDGLIPILGGQIEISRFWANAAIIMTITTITSVRSKM
jgi:hypothetical protein